jgi:CheY-like chemotaxis protein
MEDDWKNRTFIIAEDSEINYILIKKNLETSGAKILWAKNGLELIELLEKEKSIDMILLDLSMPKLDGYDATKKIREAGIGIPIIAQSAFIMDEEIDKVFEVGCDDYITKPIQKDELFAKIEALLQ